MAHLSFHAGTEGKIKLSDVNGAAGHTFRATERRYKTHSNPDIDSSRTQFNKDETIGKVPIGELVERRLASDYKGRKKMRSDAVVLREVIIQASPDVYDGLSFDDKVTKSLEFTRDSLGWLQKEFGKKNVLGYSLHVDETNPHTHIVIMPMTEDGRLSQKDFFKGPTDLKRQHREYRQHMIDLGWSFETENKYESVDGLSLPRYKANAEAVEAKRSEQTQFAAQLAADDDWQQRALQSAYDDVHARVLREEEDKLEHRKEGLDARERALAAREAEVTAKDNTLSAAHQKLKDRIEHFNNHEAENRKKVNERAAALDAKEKNVAAFVKKHTHGANAVMLALLEGDPRRQSLYKEIKVKGVNAYDPEWLNEQAKESLYSATSGIKKRVIDPHDVQRQLRQQDGPEL